MNNLELKLLNFLDSYPEVSFTYIKRDGSLRHARGTRLSSAVPYQSRPLLPGTNQLIENVPYYDYSRKEWRSYKIGSVRSIDGFGKEYRLFISNSWGHANDYDCLSRLLNEASNFEWIDYSVPKNDPIHNPPTSKALGDAICRQMRPVNCVLILGGVYSTYSTWINREIEYAKMLAKPIIAIDKLGSERMSTVVANNADAIVGWNTASIVKAIRLNSIDSGVA